MTVDELISLRRRLELNQDAMAASMGLSLRAYAAIEGRETTLRRVHILAAERVAMMRAVAEGDAMLAPENVRADCARIFMLANGLST